jgi:hypothetical protein
MQPHAQNEYCDDDVMMEKDFQDKTVVSVLKQYWQSFAEWLALPEDPPAVMASEGITARAIKLIQELSENDLRIRLSKAPGWRVRLEVMADLLQKQYNFDVEHLTGTDYTEVKTYLLRLAGHPTAQLL